MCAGLDKTKSYTNLQIHCTHTRTYEDLLGVLLKFSYRKRLRVMPPQTATEPYRSAWACTCSSCGRTCLLFVTCTCCAVFSKENNNQSHLLVAICTCNVLRSGHVPVLRVLVAEMRKDKEKKGGGGTAGGGGGIGIGRRGDGGDAEDVARPGDDNTWMMDGGPFK